jgi:hypothetical protein
MKSHSSLFADENALLAVCERCAQIAERHADLFDLKRLYPTARALRDAATEMRQGFLYVDESRLPSTPSEKIRAQDVGNSD